MIAPTAALRDDLVASATRRRRVGTLLLWLPAALALVYAVSLVSTLGSVVHAIYVDADVASAPFIGQLAGEVGPHGQIVLGNIPWYTALWFEELTRGIPAHRLVWEIAPWLLTLIGIGLLAWATTSIAGRWAGMIVAVACGCAGTTLLPLQFGWSIHGVSYVHICLLGAAIVPLASPARAFGDRRAAHILTVAALTVATGLGVASDRLVLIGGILPFLLSGLAAAWVAPRREARAVLISVLALSGGVALVAALAAAAARSENVVSAPFAIGFSRFDRILAHVGDLVQSLVYLANGNFSAAQITLTSVIAAVAAVATMAAAGLATQRSRHTVAHLCRLPRSEPGPSEPRTDPARTAFILFWVACGLIVSIVFVVSSLPVGLGTIRYVVPVGYAIIVLVAVTAGTDRDWLRRALVAIGVSAVVAGSVLALWQRQIENAFQPNGTTAGALLRYARTQGLAVGYGGYWDAAPLSWELAMRLRIYPVQACGVNLCELQLHKIGSWYSPHPGRRTFLVVDSRLAGPNLLTGPPPSLGPPTAVVHLRQLTVFVYPYDIASRVAH